MGCGCACGVLGEVADVTEEQGRSTDKAGAGSRTHIFEKR